MTVNSRFWFLALLGFVAIGSASTGGARADDAPSARNGLRVVHEWCSTCHSVEGVETDTTRAPTFASIAMREGRTREYFTRFLMGDHFPMTLYRLHDDEEADVVAFLLWLQGE